MNTNVILVVIESDDAADDDADADAVSVSSRRNRPQIARGAPAGKP